MSLTVEEILALPGLEEMTLRAGARNRQRSVRWSYVAENEGIAGWVMGGELVFVTGINHPRDEANLLRLIDEGSDCAIAGLVILTGETFIHSIPPSVIALAEARGVPLIEQPYLLRMVIVTHLIGTALVQMAQTKRSRHDILAQLLSGDYPSLATLRQRATHLQLALDQPCRLVALRLSAVSVLFASHAPEEAERLLQHTRQTVQDHLDVWSRALPRALPVIVQGDLFILLLAEDNWRACIETCRPSSVIWRCLWGWQARSRIAPIITGPSTRHARHWMLQKTCARPLASAISANWACCVCCRPWANAR